MWVNVAGFTTQFTFQVSSGSTTGDGFTFTLQNNSPQARGSSGGGLGYATIAKSAAIKFDLYSNNGEGASSTGLFINGAAPTSAGSVNLSSRNIDLHSGHRLQVSLNYDGGTLAETITDTVTGATATLSYLVDLLGILGDSQAYVGFTGGTGSKAATQDILTWSYTTLG